MDDVVKALGKDAKFPKIWWSQMMLVVFLWDGGCQELQNELKKTSKSEFGWISYGQNKILAKSVFTGSGRPEMDGCLIAGRPVGLEIR